MKNFVYSGGLGDTFLVIKKIQQEYDLSTISLYRFHTNEPSETIIENFVKYYFPQIKFTQYSFMTHYERLQSIQIVTSVGQFKYFDPYWDKMEYSIIQSRETKIKSSCIICDSGIGANFKKLSDQIIDRLVSEKVSLGFNDIYLLGIARPLNIKKNQQIIDLRGKQNLQEFLTTITRCNDVVAIDGIGAFVPLFEGATVQLLQISETTKRRIPRNLYYSDRCNRATIRKIQRTLRSKLRLSNTLRLGDIK